MKYVALSSECVFVHFRVDVHGVVATGHPVITFVCLSIIWFVSSSTHKTTVSTVFFENVNVKQ